MSIGRTSEIGREKMELADWRRQIGELYAEVRRLAAVDPAAAHARWQVVRDALYRDHPSSPVPPEGQSTFEARYFDYDISLRFQLPLIGDVPATAADAAPGAAASTALGLKLPISTGQPLGFERVGWLDVPFEAGPRRLAVFWLPEYSGGLFLPFRDGTNGRETYGGGRYLLDTGKGADLGGDLARDTIVVDFNFAYQPSCAFDPRWSCPLAPPENRLDVEVRGGERIA
jgi:uncharacterized protein (DUF1684 family)